MNWKEYLSSFCIIFESAIDNLKKKYGNISNEELSIYQSLERAFPNTKLSDMKITKRSNGEKSFSVKIDGKETAMSALPKKVRTFAYQVLNTK